MSRMAQSPPARDPHQAEMSDPIALGKPHFGSAGNAHELTDDTNVTE